MAQDFTAAVHVRVLPGDAPLGAVRDGVFVRRVAGHNAGAAEPRCVPHRHVHLPGGADCGVPRDGHTEVVQVLYGTFMATEVAYYTYIYAKISRDRYQQVTGNTRAAILSGRFLASVVGQTLVSTGTMDLRQLNYITLGAQAFSLLWSFVLPAVKSSVYFYHDANDDGQDKADDGATREKEVREEIGSDAATTTVSASVNHKSGGDPLTGSIMAIAGSNNPALKSDVNPTSAVTSKARSGFSCHRAGHLLWTHFTAAYTNLTVVQWSLWWSLAMAGFIQVANYVQLLWQEINTDQEYLYNGAAEALLTLFGALSAIVAGYVANRLFERWALWILTGCSALQGGLVLYSGFSTNIWAAYAVYILFGVLYMFMITMASATVAKYLQEDSFGLVFGINTFVALVFQSILTVVVISESGLALTPRGQFKVYGGFFLALAVIYLVPATVSLVRHCMAGTKRDSSGDSEGPGQDARIDQSHRQDVASTHF
ncbi:thiamine transporter 1-like isoform X3 [Culex pipiens pallens]|uniref:thiamine transporter 1-like isoform X3 n=1 Tax=Culex pipiens pallens TaxID=42434 RepID=UPI001952CE1A|nr:thiamine transporter 1-like isoform X3 [Culex pipiens pallens]